MPVKINIRTDVTLAELARYKERGGMVEETPHVGNLGCSTLALLSLGLEAKLVDVNIGEQDNLFFPHCLIADGKKTEIAHSCVMSTHNTVDGQEISVTDFHLNPLRALGLKAFAHSEWVFHRRGEILRLLEAITTYRNRLLWSRCINQTGVVVESCRTDFSLKSRDSIQKVTSPHNGEGWVIPNPLNILFDLVFGARETNSCCIYMLSGQSMYRYITQPYRSFGPMDQLLSELYDQAIANGFALLL